MVSHGTKVHWDKLIWNSYVPPTRAFISWRLLHDRLPTDENLRKRGCYIVSICCFCRKQSESSSHIFLHCPVTAQLWDWLSKGSGQHMDLTSGLSLVLSSVGVGGKLAHQIVNSSILHTIWCIWLERNNRYFNDKQSTISTMLNIIQSEVKLSFHLALTHGAAVMADLRLSQLFGIPLNSQVPKPIPVCHWSPSEVGCVKFNCDGSAFGTPLRVHWFCFKRLQVYFLRRFGS
jgi:hypothetical protein